MIDHAHNGGPPIINRHPDDNMYYAPWDHDDYLKGVIKLKPDVIGIYSIILNLIYSHMGALPDDDRFVAGHCDLKDIRYYQRMKAQLVATGKIYVVEGYIYNKRAMAEIAKFCETARRKRDAAAAREARKRDAERAEKEMRERVSRASDARETQAPRASDADDERASRTDKREKVNEINTTPNTAVVGLEHSSASAVAQIEKEKKEEESLDLLDTTRAESVSEASASDVDGAVRIFREKKNYSEAFEHFWRAYPETSGMSKFKAWHAWQKLSSEQRGQAKAALPAFASQLIDRRRKDSSATPLHAQGYLSQRRFETLIANPSSAQGGPWWKNPVAVAAVSPDRWRKGIMDHANGVWPVDKLGPPPGHKHCVVPTNIVTEMHLTEKYDERGICREAKEHV